MRLIVLLGMPLILLIGIAASGPVCAQPARGGSGMMYPGMMGPGMMEPGPGSATPQSATASGAAIFQSQCAQCHTLQAKAPPSSGPDLYGLFGRKAGSVPGYPYSPAMLHSGVIWNAATLDRFLAAPQAVVPGTAMPFLGLTDAQARHRLEAFLERATKQASK